MKKCTELVVAMMMCVCVCACSSAKLVLNENYVAEYGDKELDKTKLLTDDENNKDVEIIEIKDFDGMKLGVQEVNVSYKKGEKEDISTLKIEVKDTKLPVIELNQTDTINVEKNAEFDVKGNIKSVSDPIDGDIAYSEDNTIKKDGYFCESNVDVATIGDYKVTVKAYDKNGNESIVEYAVSVVEKQEEYVQDDSGNYVPNPNYVPVTNYAQNNSGSGSVDNSYSTPSYQEPTYTAPVETPQEPAQPKLCPGGQYDEYQDCDYIPAYLGYGTKGVDWFYTEADCLKKVNELGGASVGYGWGFIDGITNGGGTIWTYDMQYH